MARHLLLILILMLVPALKAAFAVTPEAAAPEFSVMSQHDQCQAPDCQTQCQIQSQWPAVVPLTFAAGTDRPVPPGIRRTDAYQPPYLEHPLRPPLFA